MSAITKFPAAITDKNVLDFESLVNLISLKYIRIRESPTPKSFVHVRDLFNRLSFTHFAELIQIEDPLKRAFVSKYQLELPKKEEIQKFLEEQLKSEKTEPARLSAKKEERAEKK
jgi:hypothetical protein